VRARAGLGLGLVFRRGRGARLGALPTAPYISPISRLHLACAPCPLRHRSCSEGGRGGPSPGGKGGASPGGRGGPSPGGRGGASPGGSGGGGCGGAGAGAGRSHCVRLSACRLKGV